MTAEAQIKRRHHYTPELYLRNFTDIRGVLHVVSLDDGRRFETTPRGVGAMKDLYRPTVEGVHPNTFEDMFGEFEAESSPVLRQVVNKRELPTDTEQLQLLFNFMAFQAVRTPSAREAIAAPIAHARRIIVDITLSSRERFERTMRQAGHDPGELSYEKFKASYEAGMQFPMVTEEFLNYAMVRMNVMLEMFAERSWSVLWTDRPNEQFFVSDHPLTLAWTDGRPSGFYGPGHAHLDTDVTFPVGSSVALLGRFDEVPPVVEATARTVASINARTVGYATTFVAAASDEFPVMRRGEVLNAAQFIEQVKEDGPRRPKEPD